MTAREYPVEPIRPGEMARFSSWQCCSLLTHASDGPHPPHCPAHGAHSYLLGPTDALIVKAEGVTSGLVPNAPQEVES